MLLGPSKNVAAPESDSPKMHYFEKYGMHPLTFSKSPSYIGLDGPIHQKWMAPDTWYLQIDDILDVPNCTINIHLPKKIEMILSNI